MKKLLLVLLACTSTIHAEKADTPEDYLKREQSAYEYAKASKDSESDSPFREYIRVVRDNYKQSWFDHHPYLTNALVAVGSVALILALAYIPQPPNNGANRARNNGNARQELVRELNQQRFPGQGQLLGGGALNPNPEGQPGPSPAA